VIIVPDGPLHLLPFVALMREPRGVPPATPGRYFIEWKPVSTVLSATVYGELSQRRAADAGSHGTGASPSVVAFGDPALSPDSPRGEQASDPERSLLMKMVTDLRPLPAAREEVDGIVALFPGSAEGFVGALATEERVKGLASHVRYVHFATHAVLDHDSPMESALVLAMPGDAKATSENGLLQAWEILEQLRLDTDLVVLSACDSGLGRELRGEGLLGLTRAFQHAGARSVVASLWRVGDQPTAALMVRFYRHLKEGAAKDEALRAAQMELIGGSVPVRDRSGRTVGRDISLPYHWAAFQLYGDWQ
jgi:CHAT domain-containing protein